MAINDIKDYKDFINYKPEIIKAINDIKKNIQNPFNINDSEENDKKSKISSILGLQFDYDSLINENDIKFFSDYEEKNTLIKNKIDSYIINNKNRDINNNTKIKSKLNKNNLKEEEKININKNKYVDNPNNLNKPLKNTEYLGNKNDKLLTKFNSFNHTNKKSIFKSKLYNTRYLHNKEKNKNKKNIFEEEEKKEKEKIDIISEIIIKMNNDNYIYDALLRLFGNNLPNKLISNKVSDDLVEAVKNAIKEMERISKKNNNKKINDKIDKLYKERIQSLKRKSKIKKKIIKNNNINSNIPKNIKKNVNIIKRYKSFNLYKFNEPYQEFDFKRSLREQSPTNICFRTNTNFNNDIIKSISKEKHKNAKKGNNSPFKMSYNQKPFISATCGYGKYFDEPLQKGGLSKLNF